MWRTLSCAHFLVTVCGLSSVIPACSSSNAASNAASSNGGEPPGDHFFDSAATTTGLTASAATQIRVGVLLFDPAYAANHPAGTPGADASSRLAIGRVSVSNAVATSGTGDDAGTSAGEVDLTGTWTTAGTVSLQGSGWRVNGNLNGAIVTGSFQGPMGTGVFAGADAVIGEVAISFGTQGGNAFDVVVSKSGAVTGVIGGASGGYVTGTASGDSLNYTWQADGQSGGGSGSAASGGMLSGTSQGGTCAPSTGLMWECADDPTSTSFPCQCEEFPTKETSFPASSCSGTYSCCYTYTDGYGTACECNADSETASEGCVNTFGDQDWTRVTSCVPPPSLSSGGSGSNCSQTWQASPAPCTAILYEAQNAPGIATGCPVFANLSGTCSGGDLAACTPPPGGCSCPASGGCATCGHVSACCLE